MPLGGNDCTSSWPAHLLDWRRFFSEFKSGWFLRHWANSPFLNSAHRCHWRSLALEQKALPVLSSDTGSQPVDISIQTNPSRSQDPGRGGDQHFYDIRSFPYIVHCSQKWPPTPGWWLRLLVAKEKTFPVRACCLCSSWIASGYNEWPAT